MDNRRRSAGVDFAIRRVDLLNDWQATAIAVPFLDTSDLCTLHAGDAETGGVIMVAAPGTGLGFALLVATDQGYRANPTEGGHMSFAPSSELEVELLGFLQSRFGHVSYERIAPGSGFHNIYDFLERAGLYEVPAWLRDALERGTDRAPFIVNAAVRAKRNCWLRVPSGNRSIGRMLAKEPAPVLAISPRTDG